MSDEIIPLDGDSDLLRSLPREDPVPAEEADELVAALRREGLIGRQNRFRPLVFLAAAAALLFAGGIGGSWMERRNSLEGALERTAMTPTERVLLLQRAGSAYVKAAQSYSDAVGHTDSTAAEVASQVLLGAASAVARSRLDEGLSERLTIALASTPAKTKTNIIWY
jgi:hypothetical protein